MLHIHITHRYKTVPEGKSLTVCVAKILLHMTHPSLLHCVLSKFQQSPTSVECNLCPMLALAVSFFTLATMMAHSLCKRNI